MATNTLVEVVDNLTFKVAGRERINWVFSQGSIIARAEDVIVRNASSPAKVLQDISTFNYSKVSEPTLSKVSFLAIKKKPTAGNEMIMVILIRY